MILYRYFSLTFGLQALQSGDLKVGRLGQLNDVFDCRPNIINIPPGSPEPFADFYFSNFDGQLGLLCYSATINDPVIWSHYAECHKGLALGFEFADFDKNLPHAVKYSTERPKLDMAKIGTLPEDRDPSVATIKLIDAGFTTKHPSWTYEQEYRHFILLNNCRMRGEHYFTPLFWHRLKEVVLGARCSIRFEDVDRILSNPTLDEAARRGVVQLNVNIRRCLLNEKSFDLAFQEMPRSPGPSTTKP